MNIYMAPMEGITGYVYRNTFAKYFKGVDKYFTPFIVPAMGRVIRTREMKDILPENNKGLNIVPQILANEAEPFLKAASMLKDYGYEEVNLNLGCPSGTVASKGRGAGALYDVEKLDAFLYEIYEADLMPISIKTRIGGKNPDEFEKIIEVYNKYQVSELIIHPRLHTDFYKNTPNLDAFQLGIDVFGSCHDEKTICYNGDINSASDYKKISERFPGIENYMLGRGLIGCPFMAEQIKNGEDKSSVDLAVLKSFHDELLDSLTEANGGFGNSQFKMKELWFYMERMFDQNEYKKQFKQIKKSKNLEEYKAAARELFS